MPAPNHNDFSPKHQRLKDYLLHMMQTGAIAPGEQLPSENLLAEQHQVSRHTVRQALGALENEGWICREQGRGTFCANPADRSAGRKIAVMTTYISDYIFPGIIRGIEEVLSASGYTLILTNTHNDLIKEAQCLEKLLSQGINGLIIEPTRSAIPNPNLTYYRRLEERHLPYLLIHAVYPDLDPAYIIMDDVKGGYLATQYLLQLGHRRIAGIFKQDDLQGLNRKRGFTQALSEYGITVEPALAGNFQTEQLSSYPFSFTQRLLQSPDPPTAIVCYNDQVALKVLEATRMIGLKVPEDISLIGYDDSSLAVATEVKLTTVRHPQVEMGRQASRLLIEMLERQVDRPHFIYPPELIIRDSCRSLPHSG
ncbi:MAG TPA: GntR family transcriptional regulator [Bacillota bacterium]